MLERVRDGAVDLGILALPVPLAGCDSRPLYDEPFMLAVPEGHRLAGRRQAAVSDLRDDPLLLLEDGHCLRDQALAACARARTRERDDFRATSIETLRQMVAAGAGVTLLPALACRGAYGNAAGMRVLPLSRPTPARRIGAIWRQGTARAAAIAACCDVIQRHCGLERAP
jgi:LysR family hydrogen peroxide-inducible transcriptional activator